MTSSNGRSDDERQAIYDAFHDRVNMAPKELEEWLDTDESKAVGDSDSGESTGHAMGRHIVEIKRTKKADLTERDYDRMNKVTGYIKRHLAQVPEKEEIATSNWRYALKNWGHDPCEDDGIDC